MGKITVKEVGFYKKKVKLLEELGMIGTANDIKTEMDTLANVKKFEKLGYKIITHEALKERLCKPVEHYEDVEKEVERNDTNWIGITSIVKKKVKVKERQDRIPGLYLTNLLGWTKPIPYAALVEINKAKKLGLECFQIAKGCIRETNMWCNDPIVVAYSLSLKHKAGCNYGGMSMGVGCVSDKMLCDKYHWGFTGIGPMFEIFAWDTTDEL